MVDALLKSVHNVNQFKRLLHVFYSHKEFYEVAENMKMVYCILKNEEYIMKTLTYSKLFTCLKKRKFFTEREEESLLTKCNEVRQIMEILKDKDVHSFRTFLLCLRELKQDDLVARMVSDEYPNIWLNNFKYFLQKRYTNSCFTETSDIDFKLPVSDDINIALIEISEEDHKEDTTFFDYYSLLLKQQAGYSRQLLNSYSDIVVENCRVVLIQGYPGSGKTFLAKRMCTKWANGSLLQTFTYVIFLQLRDVEVGGAKTFDELVELYMGRSAKVITDEIYEGNGKGILIILEGWDELPETKRHSSLFTRLIFGDLLPEAVIVITSRPSAIKSLPFTVIKRRIEILGFTEQQVKQSITHYFQNLEGSNGVKAVELFRSELRRLPLLECFVFVPINLSIALYIFRKSGYKLPDTFTDMYKNLVLIQLRRYQAKTSCGIASIRSLDDLPENISGELLRLSKMAFYEITQKELVLTFDETKIKHYCFNLNGENLENYDGMGLLQVTNHRHFESVSKTYEFIHRTLQELLAAWYLSQQTKSFQITQLRKLFDKKQFEMIWIFYAGLTKFAVVSFKELLPNTCIQKIKNLICKSSIYVMWAFLKNKFISLSNVRKLFETFYSTKLYSHYISRNISREFQVTLIAAIMEAQNPQLCKDVSHSYLFQGDTCWFSIPESVATPQVLSALSYCVAHSGKKWMIQCKGLDSDRANYFLKYLQLPVTCNSCTHFSCSNNGTYCSDINSGNSLTVFDFVGSQSQIDGSLKLIETQKCLQWLILSYCKLVDDSFIAMLSDALMHNTCLKVLNLNGCNITSEGAKCIAGFLKKNKTLQCISLQDNMATLREKDTVMLLQTIHNYNFTIQLLILDKLFHISHKIQKQLKIINNRRQWKGVNTLNISLINCFGVNYPKFCNSFILRLGNKTVSVCYHIFIHVAIIISTVFSLLFIYCNNSINCIILHCAVYYCQGI